MTLLTVTEYLCPFYGRHHDFVNRYWVFVTVLRRHHDFVNRYWVFVSFTVVTMTLLTVTECLWQFYGRHHDFVYRYWVFVTVLRSSPWLC